MGTFSMIVTIAGGLAFFLMGMTTMSDALQKVAGEGLRSLLAKITGNAFKGLLTGLFVTAIIQSSSATTVMLVSFVNAGLISLTQSIGVILGANIGTTVTGWLVSLLGFKIKISLFALPAISAGFFTRFSKRDSLKAWGEILMGFGLLFFGLAMMKHALKTPENLAMVKGWMSSIHATGIFSRILVIGLGTLVTMIIQSSSATMALTLILAFQGIIDFETGTALILGENIGTTITANLAALGASPTAKRTARAHMIFNVVAVILVLILWPLWIHGVDLFVPGSITNPHNLPIHLSAFHTGFNIINALVFLPFTGILAKLAYKMVSDKKKKRSSLVYLQYIDYSLIPTPQLALLAARQDAGVMAKNVIEMFDNVKKLHTHKEKAQGEIVSKILRTEDKIDKMAEGIVDYLVNISKASLTYDGSHEIAALIHTISDFERMGDHCEQLTKLLRRKYEKQYKFTDEAQTELTDLMNKVHNFITFTKNHLLLHEDILDKSYEMENEINQICKKLRKRNIERISSNSCMVEGGLIFINMIASLEKIGDHNTNICEEIAQSR